MVEPATELQRKDTLTLLRYARDRNPTAFKSHVKENNPLAKCNTEYQMFCFIVDSIVTPHKHDSQSIETFKTFIHGGTGATGANCVAFGRAYLMFLHMASYIVTEPIGFPEFSSILDQDLYLPPICDL